MAAANANVCYYDILAAIDEQRRFLHGTVCVAVDDDVGKGLPRDLAPLKTLYLTRVIYCYTMYLPDNK